MRKSLKERFDEKHIPVPESGCWLWIGRVNNKGYGVFWVSGKMVLAHRYAYEQKYGPIPEDKELDHLCRVRCCANPDHAEPVTHKTNLNRGRNHWREKTHCPQGHPYSGENLYVEPDGGRICRACNSQRNKNYRLRQKIKREAA